VFSRHCFACLVLLLVPSSSNAQFQHLQKNGSVRIQVASSDGRPCDLRARVVLWPKSNSLAAAQTFTNEDCRAEFTTLASGDYYVEVSGAGIETVESPIFSVGQASQSIEVAVKRTSQANASMNSGATISVSDLNIPDKARKEFEKASALIAKQDWQKALEHLNRAVAIFPQYADAYNNLAVVYARIGQRDHERESLEKALSLNDHLLAALTNLASMDLVDRNLPEAETLLNRATAIDPRDVPSLALLAKIELLNQHYDAAVATCHKVHLMPHAPQSMVHYVAARALEAEHRVMEAMSELKTFLDEQPSGPGADLAKKEMAMLEQLPR